ncbi:MAG TPA: ABC transporter substrate-binding protein [Alphaproteobacteria bacterium]|nr:ABC transporter substrate-binding protein [Alphaproteobacteria bacterium]
MKQMKRRTVLKGLAAGAGLATLGAPAIAQANPIRLGFLTVKTGPLASGGIQMEQGLMLYLKNRGMKIAGRPVEVFTGDTGGSPAVTRTKLQEMVERDKIHCMIGPLDTASALAVDDYIRSAELPTMSVAAADDMTQRHPNPWFVRGTSTSSQCSQPAADYCAKTLGWKRMGTIADDLAYGHEMCSGFLRVFEENGGKIVQKLWPPLTVPDYGTYIAQLKTDLDGLFIGFAGSNGYRWVHQLTEYGLRDKVRMMGGMTAVDESLFKAMGDEAVGLLSASWYSAALDTPTNRKFVEQMRKDYDVEPGFYAAATNTEASVFDAACQAVDGKVEDKAAFMKALRATDIKDTVRGPVKFDDLGDAIASVYIRRVDKVNGRLQNTVIHTYENVSQFWTYGEKAFLANPVYSRDYPPATHLE